MNEELGKAIAYLSEIIYNIQQDNNLSQTNKNYLCQISSQVGYIITLMCDIIDK